MISSLFVFLLAACLVFSFNLWFPSVAKWYVSHRSGFRLTIERSECVPYRGLIDFYGIEIKNPEEMFSQNGCLKINRIMAKADLLTLFNPEMVLEESVIDVDRIICETNKRSEINILSLLEAFVPPEKEVPKSIKKLEKNDNNRKNYPVKITANKLKNKTPLKFFANNEGGRCVVRKMAVYLGTFELHNITRDGDNKEIEVNERWNFTNVRSQREVIEAIKIRLQQHGIGLVIQAAFEAIFNFPGIKSAKGVIEGMGRLGQVFFKGIAEAMGKMLPNKEDLNIESNFSKFISPMNQLPVAKNVGDGNKNEDKEAIDITPEEDIH
ncbi:MAG: hypothetical protein LBR92_03970 [Puniceicoccales bacterium]|jgi:hypothetical protein|nr:hypothetical protein [Puniceicoccales bacterium]